MTVLSVAVVMSKTSIGLQQPKVATFIYFLVFKVRKKIIAPSCTFGNRPKGSGGVIESGRVNMVLNVHRNRTAY